MHAPRTTNWMVNVVLREAAKHHAKHVARFQIYPGRLVCFSAEQRTFFSTLLEDTIAEGAKIIINVKEPLTVYHACGYRGNIQLKEREYHEFSLSSGPFNSQRVSHQILSLKMKRVRSLSNRYISSRGFQTSEEVKF